MKNKPAILRQTLVSNHVDDLDFKIGNLEKSGYTVYMRGMERNVYGGRYWAVMTRVNPEYKPPE